jgi:hypothetical protein
MRDSFAFLTFEEISLQWAAEDPRTRERMFAFLLPRFWAGDFERSGNIETMLITKTAEKQITRLELLEELFDTAEWGKKGDDAEFAQIVSGVEGWDDPPELDKIREALRLNSKTLDPEITLERSSAFERLAATKIAAYPQSLRPILKGIAILPATLRYSLGSAGIPIPEFLKAPDRLSLEEAREKPGRPDKLREPVVRKFYELSEKNLLPRGRRAQARMILEELMKVFPLGRCPSLKTIEAHIRIAETKKTEG